MSRTLSSLRGKVGFLSKSHSRKGLHLALWGESPGFSPVAARNLGLLSSYGRDLRDPLLWPQESPESLRVTRVLSGFLSRRYRVLGPHLDLRREPHGSSTVLTWISGFLWSFNREARPGLMWRHASPLSSRAVTVLSGFLSS